MNRSPYLVRCEDLVRNQGSIETKVVALATDNGTMKDLEMTLGDSDMLLLKKKVLGILGARRLTLPELVTSIHHETQEMLQGNHEPIYQVLNFLHKQNHIIIQPAIQQDNNGRFFCGRCLQFTHIIMQQCGACGEPCPVCTACAVYGETRGCIPLIAAHKRSAQEVFKGERQNGELREEQSNPLYPHPLSDLQVTASKRIATIVENGKSGLLWAVCGAGKTELIFETIAEERIKGKKVLVTTPRKDVVFELFPRFQAAFPSDVVHAVFGGSQDKHKAADITIATTHQLIRYVDDAFDLVIIDETDAFPYAGDPVLYQHAHRLGRQFVYMTATPNQDLIHQVEKGQLALVTLFQRHHQQPLPVPTWVRCTSYEANILCTNIKGMIRNVLQILQYNSKNRQIQDATNSASQHRVPRLSRDFIKVLEQLPCEGVVMFFVPSIAKGKWLHSQLSLYITSEQLSIELTFVYASDPERVEKISDLRNERYQWIICTTILERGVTIPNSHVVVIDAEHKVFTKSTLIQIAGRVGRTVTHPNGNVIFMGKYLHRPIQNAIDEIQGINKAAATLRTR
ncbi:hypothetical protein BHU72_00130 [Desulfuribacillus stibiiarsenatis]|uniref:DNA/RNA helicase n=1 Tax=Desulfuribacillus stibiiarsenatis TaxID=1390249 RepID=A0A1E5L995_9FIRM|nr:DEAD/DEAH box helicase [Desulfuribacillus stibiiarsenatis]OEH86720.1 hypothetical protein BHU72_00130 [Desulfuribacillus stibiiarsenatis]